jgi:hypothetical protein
VSSDQNTVYQCRICGFDLCLSQIVAVCDGIYILICCCGCCYLGQCWIIDILDGIERSCLRVKERLDLTGSDGDDHLESCADRMECDFTKFWSRVV